MEADWDETLIYTFILTSLGEETITCIRVSVLRRVVQLKVEIS